jgi:hypothetical protein
MHSADKGKGKGKATETVEEEEDEDDDDEEEEEDEDEGEEDEDEDMEVSASSASPSAPMADGEMQEDSLEEIDATAIVSGGRRTRGKVVDYSSAEAYAKAGIKHGDDDDE